MGNRFLSVLTCFFVSLLALVAATTAKAANVLPQGPCAYVSGACLTFAASSPAAVPVVRQFTFNMPGAGRALVQFDGSMQCVSGTSSNYEVVDLAAQIVPTSATVPVYTGPGGNRYAMRFPPATSFFTNISSAINLSVTRTFNYNSGGPKTVFYKMQRLRMDPNTSCNVLSAYFTVVTFP